MTKPQPSHNAIEVFSRVTYFSGVDEAALQAAARSAVQRSFDAGQVVFLEGEPCAGLFIVESGWLKSIKISPSGREQIIRVVGPGDSFNEIGVLAGEPNQVTVETLEPARLWVIPRQALLELIDRHPVLCQMVIQNLALRTLHLMNLVEDLSLRPLEARLARFLLEQAAGDIVSRKRWSTQAELASRLGTVPEVLNRVLRGMVEEGLILLERQQIHILDRHKLEERAMLGG